MSNGASFQYQDFEPTPGLHVIIGHGQACGSDWSDVFPRRYLADLSDQRAKEHAALAGAWRFLCALQGREVTSIQHTEAGAPKVAQGEISLTHAWREGVLHVGVAWTLESRSVGIDIEFPRSALERTAPRIFTTRELAWADSLHEKCLVWTIKESVWKAAGPELAFTEIEALTPATSVALEDSTRFGGEKAVWTSLPIQVKGLDFDWWTSPLQDGWVSVGRDSK